MWDWFSPTFLWVLEKNLDQWQLPTEPSVNRRTLKVNFGLSVIDLRLRLTAEVNQGNVCLHKQSCHVQEGEPPHVCKEQCPLMTSCQRWGHRIRRWVDSEKCSEDGKDD